MNRFYLDSSSEHWHRNRTAFEEDFALRVVLADSEPLNKPHYTRLHQGSSILRHKAAGKDETSNGPCFTGYLVIPLQTPSSEELGLLRRVKLVEDSEQSELNAERSRVFRAALRFLQLRAIDGTYKAKLVQLF